MRDGESGWLSSDPAVQAVTKGEPIRFNDGRPDFTPWSKLAVNFQPGELTGNRTADWNATIKAPDASENPDVRAAGSGEIYMDQHDLTAHHATDACIQLIPSLLNAKVAHIGGAADIRYQGGLGLQP